MTTTTVVSFENENPETIANSQLKQNLACVVINGLLTKESNMDKKVVAVPSQS